MRTERVAQMFEEPTVNGEIAPAPRAGLPAVPAPPPGFEPVPPPGEEGATQARDGARRDG